jgi:hypothetical protein
MWDYMSAALDENRCGACMIEDGGLVGFEWAVMTRYLGEARWVHSRCIWRAEGWRCPSMSGVKRVPMMRETANDHEVLIVIAEERCGRPMARLAAWLEGDDEHPATAARHGSESGRASVWLAG